MDAMAEAIFCLEGRFDDSAALHLREQVLIDRALRAVLDFSHVENFDDSTLALLTVNLVLLRRSGRQVALRGLREHQLRVLHHFGVRIANDGLAQVGSDTGTDTD